ncbi:MAG: hypothetical protein ACE37N_10930, partial [Pseudohongiellaceae bacterium]
MFGLYRFGPAAGSDVDSAAAMQSGCAVLADSIACNWQDPAGFLGGSWRSASSLPASAESIAASASLLARRAGEHPVSVLAHARIDNREELADRLALPRAEAAMMD